MGRALLTLRRRRRGFTLVEMILVFAIFGTLIALAVPLYQEYVEKARVAKAAGDIEAIQADLSGYEFLGKLPTTLAEIGRGNLRDPWGRPYVYLKFDFNKSSSPPSGARKDRFLVPINSTYDLYSMGPDGLSSAPLTSGDSYDDVIRANDGAFIGRASEF